MSKWKLFLFSWFIVNFLILSNVFAQQSTCDIAIPRYGVVQCQSTSSYEYPTISFNCVDSSCSASFTCVSNCQITNKDDIKTECGSLQINQWKVYVNDVEKKNFPITFSRNDQVTVQAQCTQLIKNYPVKSTSQVKIQQLLIMIYEGWAGTLPTAPIQGTESCTLNKVAEQYKPQADVQSYLNPVTGTQETKPSSTYTNVGQLPTNWKVGETYIFVKDWQTGVADISLTYDKQNKPYWCGGQFGSRKIYNVNQITSASGNCYAIPTSVALQNIQCCFPSDCLSVDPSGKLTCNPDTWKCEETKPCNSNLDCQQTFNSGVCQNKQMTSWSCDLNKKWGNYAGTCIKQTKTVFQCSSECTDNEYYNDVEGKCKPKITILDCPAEKCCESNGNYNAKSCLSGLVCCHNADPIIGECKSSCIKTVEKTKSSPISGEAVLVLPSSSPPISAILITTSIILFVGVGGYLAWKKKLLSLPQKNVSKAMENGKIKYCIKCGAKQNFDKKFCTKCGGKLK